VIASAVVERYARAIFELGVESGQLVELTRQIQRFAEIYAANKELRVVLGNPLVSEEQRDALLKELGQRIGAGEHALNAVLVLAQRRRLPALPDVARRLGELNDEKAGVVRAKVISATPLSEDFYQRLGQTLEAGLKKRVMLEREHDPSLIAGIITKIGDNTIDGSVKGRLAARESSLLQT
jgi:F-type H+-transporting ATPase subunit delta